MEEWIKSKFTQPEIRSAVEKILLEAKQNELMFYEIKKTSKSPESALIQQEFLEDMLDTFGAFKNELEDLRYGYEPRIIKIKREKEE